MTDQPADTANTALPEDEDGALPSIHANEIQGFCPACGHAMLAVGEGGYLTCILMDCPDPNAASKLLGAAEQPEPDVAALHLTYRFPRGV